MDANVVINLMGSLMSSGATTTGMLFVSLLGLAGALVVWAKL